MRLESTPQSLDVYNIVATVPGRVPRLRDSLVVYVAHYDHVGIVPGLGPDSIFNGMVDNATGVAALLELARVIHARPLDRTAVFLFTTGEEEGSLGSRYELMTDRRMKARTVLAVNIDHPPPLAVPARWFVEANDSSGARAARAGASSMGALVTIGASQPTSDHWSFVAAGLPALFLVPDSGWRGVTPKQEQELTDRWWRPHRADDQWSPDFPLAGLAAVVDFAWRTGKLMGRSTSADR